MPLLQHQAQYGLNVGLYVHIYNTHSRENLYREHTRSSLGQRSVKFKGSCLWNSLPDELKSVITVHSFAKHSKKFMIDKYVVLL